ncbi:MAG: tetratricopeptide repeat protein [Burkholderiales bacterium]|nr:tetratricopeptide repeat protein [Burkholderiales bacterium]
MSTKDYLNHALSGATARSVDHFETACHELRCYVGDPLASAQAALDASPDMTMGHVLVAYLNLLGTESPALPAARAALAAARALPANEREAAHCGAIEHLVNGRWHAAGLALEDLSVRYPRDALALQAGHSIDFFVGDSRMLRDRIARAVGHWQPDMPGYHAVLGMHAFGLEETGAYARAEAVGRRAVEMQPRDGWAWHAVAHVMEMQGRRREGIAWLGDHSATWSEGSFFATHNWWHLALFHLGMDHVDEVLDLVDRQVLGPASPVVLNMIDASAILWRLELRGIETGARWQALAERWAPHIEAGNYAFNDMHAMMAFVGSGRDGDAERLLAAQERALAGGGDNVDFLRDVGHAATRAVLAFGQRRYTDAVQLLRPVRSQAHRFGGSHAQRDLIDLTLIEAAERGGEHDLADALRREREMALPA